jgi:hypothetical protein
MTKKLEKGHSYFLSERLFFSCDTNEDIRLRFVKMKEKLRGLATVAAVYQFS